MQKPVMVYICYFGNGNKDFHGDRYSPPFFCCVLLEPICLYFCKQWWLGFFTTLIIHSPLNVITALMLAEANVGLPT
jgi:hypothetical protein